MKSPQKKSADRPRESDEDKAAQRLAFFRAQRGIVPPAEAVPAAPKAARRKSK